MSHIMPFLALTALLSILPSTFTSFLAVGPPAAPSLASRGSAGGFLKESLDIKSPKINYATNYSSAATQSEYFWLADSTWNHKVSLKSTDILSIEIVVTGLDAICE
jgi:hypothetical protein